MSLRGEYLMSYDELLKEIEDLGIDLIEANIPGLLKGLYIDGAIILKKDMSLAHKKCILAEEIGHHLLNVGNILDQRKMSNRKQEMKARKWAYEKLIPLQMFIDAHCYGCSNFYELVEFFEVTPEFLKETLMHYSRKYGNIVDENEFIIKFDPLEVLEKG